MPAEFDRARRSPDSGPRLPPHNLQAEESLLGAMLLSRDAIASAVEIVTADAFYKPAHGHIFEAITSLFGAGEPVDPVTVADELRRANLLDAIGGAASLITIQSSTPATTSAARYAKIVDEYALLRRLIGVAGEIAEIGYSRPDDVVKAVDHAESMVFEVAQRRVTDTLAPIRDLLDASLDRLEQLYERGEAITGLPTGYNDLDAMLAGLQPSNLVVVGARPAVGKSSFALGMASHAALEAGRPALVFNLEMSQLEVAQRILCAEARVDATKVRTGRLNEADWSKLSHAVGRLAEAPLYIDDNPNVTIMDIRAKARRLKSRVGDIGVVIIDYVQLMTGRSSAESRQVEVSEISRNLKILARELNTPVVALAQLNRQLEARADKRPMLSDLRESGCLAAESKVLRADTGAEVTMGELLLSGERNIPVWSVNDEMEVVPAIMSHVFPSGVKAVYELVLQSGRRVRASANHPFLTPDRWCRLDELTAGSYVAIPVKVPDPIPALRPSAFASAALRELFVGALAAQSDEPEGVDDGADAGAPAAAAGPTPLPQPPSPQSAQSTPSASAEHEPAVTSVPEPASIAAAAAMAAHFRAALSVGTSRSLAGDRAAPVPFGAALPLAGPVFQAGAAAEHPAMPWPQQFGPAATNPNRFGPPVSPVAEAMNWDRVVCIKPVGKMPVYDATVFGTHNFFADGVLVHNSLEQDADVVLFLYRDEVYNPDTPDKGTAEVLVAKHRNGPTGKVRLAWLDHYTKFANMARINT